MAKTHDSAAATGLPAGIQQLLQRAAADEAFAEALLERRADVAAAAGVRLSRSEQAILAAITPQQLRTIIAAMVASGTRRQFLHQSAASAAVLLGGGALLAACDNPLVSTAGISPDMPPPGFDPVPISPSNTASSAPAGSTTSAAATAAIRLRPA